MNCKRLEGLGISRKIRLHVCYFFIRSVFKVWYMRCTCVTKWYFLNMTTSLAPPIQPYSTHVISTLLSKQTAHKHYYTYACMHTLTVLSIVHMAWIQNASTGTCICTCPGSEAKFVSSTTPSCCFSLIMANLSQRLNLSLKFFPDAGLGDLSKFILGNRPII